MKTFHKQDHCYKKEEFCCYLILKEGEKEAHIEKCVPYSRKYTLQTSIRLYQLFPTSNSVR